MRPAKRNTGMANTGRVLLKMTGVAASAVLMQAAFLIAAAAAQTPPAPAPAAVSQPAATQSDDRLPVKLAKIPIGNGMSLNVVEIDLADGALEIAHVTAANYPKRSSFDEFIRLAAPAAAINACFFDMDSGRLVGHVYRDGRREIEGAFSAAFAVTSDNRPVIDRLDRLGYTGNYKVIIACVDILIKDGIVLVKSKADLVKNGHDPSRRNDIYRPARWSAIGIGRDGKAYLVATANLMSIYTFAREVRERTCITDLLGLDGGSSAGLYFRGSVVVRPMRAISSVIAVRTAEVEPRMIAGR